MKDEGVGENATIRWGREGGLSPSTDGRDSLYDGVRWKARNAVRRYYYDFTVD